MTPPGYKKTEVGLIPVEWEVPRVGDVCGCIVPGRNKPKLFDGDIPWITTPDLEDGKPVSSSRIGLYVSRAEAKSVGSKVVPDGSVLMSCAGELGIVALTQNEIVVNQQLHVFLPTPRIDATFLLNALSYRKDQIAGLGTKTAVPYLNKSSCNSIPVPLPPLPEQRAIATALSDVDGLLGALDRLIAKKRDLKQAAMQQLLTGQSRLPGFHEEWVMKRLNELADIRSGGTPSTSVAHFWDGNIPWCTPTDITALNGHKYLGETNRLITPLGLKASSSEMIPAHSIVMTSRATIGECAINTVPVSTNQGFKNFVPFDSTDVDFLYYLLTTQKQGFISLCGGSTFLEIGKTQLIAYQVNLPNAKAEQTAIASVLSEMDAELAGLEQRRDKTRALKQGMMQELLTGRTRLVASPQQGGRA